MTPSMTLDDAVTASMTLDDAVAGIGGFEAVRLLGDGSSRRPNPHFIFGPCTREQMSHFHGDQYMPAVCVYVARNVEVAGPWFMTGALLSHDGVHLSCRELALDPASPEARARLAAHEAARRDGSRPLRRIAGRSILLATNGHQIYGHWLIDFLPKLYVLDRAGFGIDDINILLPTNMDAFGAHYLDLLGFDPDRIIRYDPDREALLAEELLIPTVLRWGGRLSAAFADSIAYLNQRIDRFNRVPVMRGGGRVFLSRASSGVTTRPLVNQEAIEALALEAGFSVVHPERLPLLEQIGIFRSARRVIGQYGSALHATIFSRPGVVVGGLHGPSPATFDALQSGIAERLGQTTGYVFGTPHPAASNRHAMTVSEDDFTECVGTFFG